jgi:membrane-associated protease RseP (regulator of RpoE activity)
MNDPEQNNPPDFNDAIIEIIRSEVPDYKIYEHAYEDGVYFLYGNLTNETKDILKRLWVPLSNMGYDVQMSYELGEHVLIVSPIVEQKERIWINVLLASITFFTTMFVGSFMFGADPFSKPIEIFKGLPFTLAIMFVLGSHEMGHYFVAKIHGMKTSLPYFIPFPSIVGTMGAVIKNKGPIPSRKALFDVGVAGPVVGLIASIAVTAIGLSLPPVILALPENGLLLNLSLPPLFLFIDTLLGGIGENIIIHPVAFAGWVGMLVTALNLIPAGQLDGGHMLRSMLGPRADFVSGIMPFILLSVGFFVYYVMHENGAMWIFWGLFIMLFATGGHPEPLDDADEIGSLRKSLGILVFAAGLLCVTLSPIQM